MPPATQVHFFAPFKKPDEVYVLGAEFKDHLAVSVAQDRGYLDQTMTEATGRQLELPFFKCDGDSNYYGPDGGQWKCIRRLVHCCAESALDLGRVQVGLSGDHQQVYVDTVESQI